MTSDNATRLSTAFAAMAETGALDGFVALLANDVVLQLPGRNVTSGAYRGRDAVLATFGDLINRTAGTLRDDWEEVLGDDRYTVAIARISGEIDGRRLDQRGVWLDDWNDAGLVTRIRLLMADQPTADAFWGPVNG